MSVLYSIKQEMSELLIKSLLARRLSMIEPPWVRRAHGFEDQGHAVHLESEKSQIVQFYAALARVVTSSGTRVL